MNPHPHALLMSLIQPLGLGCEPLEDETNYDTPLRIHETILKLECETAIAPLEGLIALSNYDEEEMIPSSYLDPHTVMGERYPLGELQGASFQTLMKCKEQKLVWEDGSPHGRSTKGRRRRRYPQGVEWVWMRRKRLIFHL